MLNCSVLYLPVQLPFMSVVIAPASALGLGLYLGVSQNNPYIIPIKDPHNPYIIPIYPLGSL